VKRIGIGLIRVYRVVFAWLPSSCRYEPSCSRYAEQAIRVHGPLRGTLMALRRLSHCHPLSRHDPVDPVRPR